MASSAPSVTGTINPIEEICRVALDLGVAVCVDASQSVPHQQIDLSSLQCDFLVFSGHKMLGPTGIGVLAGTDEALSQIKPLIVGGGCVDRVTADG